MNIIYETERFIVDAYERPLNTRRDGGHIVISPKKDYTDRTKLPPKEAIELMRLTMAVGEALETGLQRRGIPVVKVNYHDDGNWAVRRGEQPRLHIHVYGRAADATRQPWPEAMKLPFRETGFYDGVEPLDEEDVAAIRAEMERLFKEPRYSDAAWGLDGAW